MAQKRVSALMVGRGGVGVVDEDGDDAGVVGGR